MALAGAVCAVVHTITGFTNHALLGAPYTTSQMTYDLRRLRLKGLITRLPHTNTYVLTPDGQKVVGSGPP
jgi:predicted MarR family transcription regulator